MYHVTYLLVVLVCRACDYCARCPTAGWMVMLHHTAQLKGQLGHQPPGPGITSPLREVRNTADCFLVEQQHQLLPKETSKQDCLYFVWSAPPPWTSLNRMFADM